MYLRVKPLLWWRDPATGNACRTDGLVLEEHQMLTSFPIWLHWLDQFYRTN